MFAALNSSARGSLCCHHICGGGSIGGGDGGGGIEGGTEGELSSIGGGGGDVGVGGGGWNSCGSRASGSATCRICPATVMMAIAAQREKMVLEEEAGLSEPRSSMDTSHRRTGP